MSKKVKNNTKQKECYSKMMNGVSVRKDGANKELLEAVKFSNLTSK